MKVPALLQSKKISFLLFLFISILVVTGFAKAAGITINEGYCPYAKNPNV
jgi:hypothetical protein